MAKELDGVDQAIVNILLGNARMSISDIARNVHRSRTAVESRLDKLENAGVIRGYRVILDPAIDPPRNQQAFIIIKHTGVSDCEAVWQELRQFQNVLECHSLFGQLDLIVKVCYSSLEELVEIKTFLSVNPRVKDVVVSPVMKTWMDTR